MIIAEREPRECQKPNLTPLRGMGEVREVLGRLSPDKVRSATPEDQKKMVGEALGTVVKVYYRDRRFWNKMKDLEPIIVAFKDGRVTFDELLQAVTPERAVSGNHNLLGTVRKFLGR